MLVLMVLNIKLIDKYYLSIIDIYCISIFIDIYYYW